MFFELDKSKIMSSGERFNSFPVTISTFNNFQEEAFLKNIVGKGENAGIQHFLVFSQFFLP